MRESCAGSGEICAQSTPETEWSRNEQLWERNAGLRQEGKKLHCFMCVVSSDKE